MLSGSSKLAFEPGDAVLEPPHVVSVPRDAAFQLTKAMIVLAIALLEVKDAGLHIIELLLLLTHLTLLLADLMLQ